MRPGLDEVVAVVREFAAIGPDRQISMDTRMEADLGITGDDGVDLLRAVESRFDVAMGVKDGSLRSVFDLAENEYLFGSEGLEVPFLNRIYRWITGNPAPVIRDLTVGELVAVIRKSRDGTWDAIPTDGD